MTHDGHVWIGLGANLGDPVAQLQAGLQALCSLPGVRLVALSPLYRTAPIDALGDDYYNAVVGVDTAMSPHALLTALQGIEHELGRTRPFPNAPRTLDLDVLLWGDEVLQTPELTVPHPRMHERAFVLAPLRAAWPRAVVPGRGRVDELLAALPPQRIEELPPLTPAPGV